MKKTIDIEKATATIKNLREAYAEEATIEEKKPVHPMEDIIVKNQKFEKVNFLLELLCEQMGIDKESQPKDVLMAIGKVFEEYYAAMDEWRTIKNGNQGRDGKKFTTPDK